MIPVRNMICSNMVFITMLLLSTVAAQAQNPYKSIAECGGDTLQYLQYNFVDNKSRYIGQKFEKLLQDYEKDLPIKSCLHKFKREVKGGPGKISKVELCYLDRDQSIRHSRQNKQHYYLIVNFSPELQLMKNPSADNTELPSFANFFIEEENKKIVAYRMKEAIVSDIAIDPGLSNKTTNSTAK